MHSFVSYLRDVKKDVTTSNQSIKLVMGNTSGDMDSIVGAMALGFFLTLKTGQMWTPVVNCAKKDLALKTEIYVHVIEDCKLNLDDLFFWDEMLELKRPIDEIAIIDHNMIDEEQAEQLGDNAHSKVTYIYDHHFDNKFYPASQLKDSKVRFIGSACSLLVLMMKENEAIFDKALFDKSVKPNYAYFMAAAVVLDSANLNEALRDTKWQQEDQDAYEWLSGFTELG